MHVGVDVSYMCTNFCGWSLSGFRDIATLKFDQIFLFDHGLWSMVVKKLNHLELDQNFYASRG